MRAVFLFCISLCFLLLRGDSYAYARAHHNMLCYTPAQHTEKFQQVKAAGAKATHAVIASADFSDKNEYLIDVDDEDASLARKYVLLVKYTVVLSYTFIFFYLYRCVKKRLHHSGHLFYNGSCKYLLQRSLRI